MQSPGLLTLWLKGSTFLECTRLYYDHYAFLRSIFSSSYMNKEILNMRIEY